MPSNVAAAGIRCYIRCMDVPTTYLLPKDFLSELEQKFFWWEPIGSQPRSEVRILAQAMSLASFEDTALEYARNVFEGLPDEFCVILDTFAASRRSAVFIDDDFGTLVGQFTKPCLPKERRVGIENVGTEGWVHEYHVNRTIRHTIKIG
jgi:hypothetical protein